MLCCFDSFGDPHKAYNRQTSDGIVVSSFPGQRMFQNTDGNALSAPPPQSNMSTGDGDMIAVTVPLGVQSGQTIQINSPDGRTIHAQVPNGMTAGSQFMVQMPARTVSPLPPSMEAPAPTSIVQPQDYSTWQPLSPPEPFVPAVPTFSPGHGGATTIPASRTTVVPSAPYMTNAVATPIGYPISPLSPPSQLPSYSPKSTQKLMKVSVPSGMPPGSTIHVQVPGEKRTIAATIPPGVSEFHVSYECKNPVASAPVHRIVQPQQPQAPQGQKLLLVRVPPGTPPGTMLHVTIPEEPGRVVSATVPPNVTEFHVSYMPSQKQQQQQHTLPMNNNGNSSDRYHNNNNRNSSNRNCGMGSMMMPMLGGAALGATGMSMFGHHNNNNNYDGGYKEGDGGANAGGGNDYHDDYGGRGGDDFGGFGDY